ncbi:MAG: leucine-rich repeat protein [Clostridia bacterium]|nr:leucine-rich repeat protein [Clostridia bacterium]
MKKIISVLMAVFLTVPCFSLTSFSLGIGTMFEKDGILYADYLGEGEVYVAGYNSEYFEKGNCEVAIPETVKGGFWKTYTVTGVDMYAFAESHFTKIMLPSTINYIGDGAFEASVDLTEVVIPDECYFDYFGYDAFLGTMAEEKLFDGTDTAVIGENVLFSYAGDKKNYVIDEDIDILLNGCFAFSGVESVVLNEKIQEIPTACFAGCRNLESFIIPDTITYINDGAFKDCVNLKKVTLGENVFHIGAQAFSNTAIETIHLPASVNYLSGAFADCKTLKNITVDEGNGTFVADENALYQVWYYEYEDFDGNTEVETGKALEFYFPSKVNKVVKLADDVTQISDYAFYYCKNLEEVYAPSVNSVGINAFSGTGIRKFDADNCEYFYDSSFRNCKNLEEINLENAWYIATAAFENCTSLKNVKPNEGVGVVDGAAFANTAIEEIEIYGEDVWLGEAVFKNCKNLKKVILGDGIYSMAMNTFLGCEKLETVCLSKTIKSIEDNTFNGCENVNFEVIKNTKAHRELKELGYNFEVVGKLTFIEEITNFFEMINEKIYELLFGWMFEVVI